MLLKILKYQTCVYILLFFYLNACKPKENQELQPPPTTPTIICSQIKDSCYAKGFERYKPIKANFFKDEKGVLNELKVSLNESCCNKYFYFDETLGYESNRQPLQKVIDIASFQNFDSTVYSKDRNHVYYFGENTEGGRRFIIDNADVKTFKIFENANQWGIDKKHLYFKNRPLYNLIISKIQVIKNIETNKILFVKDNKNVFQEDNKLLGVDASTFTLVPLKEQAQCNCIAKDNNNFYDISGQVVKK